MKRDLASRVYEEIKGRILAFKLLPGVKLSDDEVAAEFGISRTPVREALSRLAEQGLVENRPNKGYWVRVFSKKEVQDLYVLRNALEGLAVEIATRKMTATKEAGLRRLLDGYPALMKSQDLVRFNDADERFHDLIARYSENGALYETLQNLQGKIRIVRRYDHLRPTSFQETYDEHLEILEHMVARRPNRAREAMARHLLVSMNIVLGLLPD